MILVDANLLLYAYNLRAAEHDAARTWLEATLSGTALVRFAWLSVWAFVRISTNPRVFEHPMTVAQADAIVTAWLSRPNASIVEPGERHWEIARRLLRSGQATGPLVMDVALAAIAIEHGATLYTTDRDFARFEDLTWKNPLL